MKRSVQGLYVVVSTVGETCKAFIPSSLPPKPEIQISDQLQHKIDQALLSLGRLDSISQFLPEASLLLYMFIRKEAVLSSQIEGTQSSLSDLLLSEVSEVPGVPIDDIKEVSNYVAALTHGLNRIEKGFPISSRLIREIHKILLSSGRGKNKRPGAFRQSQYWVGGSRPGNAIFIPPPPDYVISCMSDLEKFIHNKKFPTSILIKTALVHVQFETIHPFLDGNGRIGRLLIPLLFCTEKVLKQPMLYLSLYFKNKRERYYELLQKVRLDGDWESWIDFFIDAITETANKTVQTTMALLNIAKEDQNTIQQLKRISGSALRVYQVLFQKPIISISKACEMTDLYPTTVTTVMKQLEQLNIIREITGQKRNRLFSYDRYIKILNEGT